MGVHRRSHGPASSGGKYDVFISHAGQQKDGFAVWIKRELHRQGVSAFLDERSLRLGDAADAEMEVTLRRSRIVIVVLTSQFVESAYCMKELRWALDMQLPRSPVHDNDTKPDASPSAAASTAATPTAAAAAAGEQARLNAEARIVMPVFYKVTDVEKLQLQLDQQLAADADPKLLAQLRTDLEEVCRRTGKRADSAAR